MTKSFFLFLVPWFTTVTRWAIRSQARKKSKTFFQRLGSTAVGTKQESERRHTIAKVTVRTRAAARQQGSAIHSLPVLCGSALPS